MSAYLVSIGPIDMTEQRIRRMNDSIISTEIVIDGGTVPTV